MTRGIDIGSGVDQQTHGFHIISGQSQVQMAVVPPPRFWLWQQNRAGRTRRPVWHTR
jgi:hypothetical protein